MKKQIDLGLRCLSRPFWPIITRVQNFRTYIVI